MAGLDAVKEVKKVKKYKDGGDVTYSDDSLDVNSTKNTGGGTGVLSTISKTGQVTPTSKIALDPESSAQLSKNLQDMIDERSGFMNTLVRNGMMASAFAMPAAQRATALPAIAAQNAAFNKDTAGMKERQLAMQAAQNAQQRFEANKGSMYGMGSAGAGGAGGAPGAGGMGGIMTPPPMIQQAIHNARTQEDADKIYNQWSQKAAEVFSNPGAYKQDMFTDEEGHQRPMNMFEIMAQKKAGAGPYAQQRPQGMPSMYGADGVTPRQGGAPAEDIAEQMFGSIYQQESSGGKADTSGFNKFGVTGPMQIKDTTFKQYQDQGVIPKDYDISNPAHNKEAGKLIIKDIAKKHNGDPEKVAAEYYGGPGAINADGTIKRDRKPADGKGPSIGEYVDAVKGRLAKGTTVQPQQQAQAPGVTQPEGTQKPKVEQSAKLPGENNYEYQQRLKKEREDTQAAEAARIKTKSEENEKSAGEREKKFQEEYNDSEKARGLAKRLRNLADNKEHIFALGAGPLVGSGGVSTLAKMGTLGLSEDAANHWTAQRVLNKEDLADWEQLQSASKELGMKFTAANMPGSRLGAMVEKLGGQAKGVGPEFTASQNKMALDRMIAGADVVDGLAELKKAYYEKNGKNAPYSEFENSPQVKDFVRKKEAELDAKFPDQFRDLKSKGGAKPGEQYEYRTDPKTGKQQRRKV